MRSRLKNSTVLVTGATGFVGSRLVRRLAEEGSRVHVITRLDSKFDQIKGVLDKITVHYYDGSTEMVISILAESAPQIVFHLASLFISEHRAADIQPLINSNLLFGTQLLEAMKSAGIAKLVNTGTSWQHYHNERYNPVNLYSATKQAFEAILRYYLETSPLQAVTLKLFDTYGPGDPRPKLMHLLQRIADSGEALAMSPGEQLIDLVHVDDVTDAFLLAGERLINGQIEKQNSYAVSSGHPITLKELAQLIGDALNMELNIEWGGRPYREREVMVPWNPGQPLPGWRPRIGLEEGVRATHAGLSVKKGKSS